ncbi:bromodomain-containing protein [Besnoitia besnoiti]|uniref:Bromodomain-containing protein n=1 Tax=Besnoitia besnoiti TaxID=94643 RepID=A0A2A9MPI0_BESBE|nr:bromodomain-containing protein [Besnoitia besnoiti]PFH37712.1 bromodomain-containing protein [Besnoitia besnoiti]
MATSAGLASSEPAAAPAAAPASGAPPLIPSPSLAAASPFFPIFRLARQEPVEAFKEAFERTLEKHRLEVAEQNAGVPDGDLPALQAKLIRETHLLVDPTSRGTLLFEVAQRAKDEEAVALAKFLVDEKRLISVAQRDRMQQTCLFYAAREGHVALCSFLIERGCDPNATDSVGQTCLFYASREGRAACIAEILERGGNPNLIDINRQSCLFYAARENRLDAVRVLLEKGADPHVKDTLRKTAWHFAKANNHLAVCALLKGSSGAGALPARTCSSVSSLSSFSSFSGAVPASPNSTSALGAGSGTPLIGLGDADGRGKGAGAGAKGASPGMYGVGDPAGCAEVGQQRKKYRLQFQPLPDECPDLWLFAGNEKLTEFERLFPSLSVWRREEADSSAGAAGQERLSQNHYESIHLAVVQNAQQAALGGAVGMDLLGLWQGAANALLSELSKYEGGHIFEKPVDPKTAPGYYDVVTRPMSFSCIKAKIRKSDYTHPMQFLKDVEQVFINCEIYNQQGSWVWSIGKNMQKFFTNQVMITRFHDYVEKYNKIYNVLARCASENQRAAAASSGASAEAKTGQPAEAALGAADEAKPSDVPSAPTAASAVSAEGEKSAASAAECDAAAGGVEDVKKERGGEASAAAAAQPAAKAEDAEKKEDEAKKQDDAAEEGAKDSGRKRQRDEGAENGE